MDAFDLESSFHNLDNHPLCPVCLDCVKAYQTDLWKKHVIFFQGNSLRLAENVRDIVEKLRGAGMGQGPIIVSLDAQHSFDATLVELHLYAELVDVDSYLIVQDARLDATYNRAGPMTAGLRLLEESPPQWIWDRNVEVLGHTQHLWLRRIAPGRPVELSFFSQDEDLVVSTPFSLFAEGSQCGNSSKKLQEIDWAGSLPACQAICLRKLDSVCRYLMYIRSPDPPICVLLEDCLDLQREPTSEVYERFL